MLQTKRWQIYQHYKKKAIDSYMQKIRIENIKQQTNQAMNSLIENTSDRISPDQLGNLMMLLRSGRDEMVIHLGNLLIDGVVVGDWVEGKLPFDSICSGYVFWLLAVMYERRAFGQWEWQALIAKIGEGNYPELCKEHGVPLLHRIVKDEKQAGRALIKGGTECLLQICNYSLTSSPSISGKCYSIINSLMGESEVGREVLGQIGEGVLWGVIKCGIQKQQKHLRVLCYQIMGNMSLDTEICFELVKEMGKKCKGEKLAVLVEMSYVMLNIFSHGGLRYVLKALHCGVIQVLNHLSDFTHPQIQHNHHQCLKLLQDVVEQGPYIDQLYIMGSLNQPL